MVITRGNDLDEMQKVEKILAFQNQLREKKISRKNAEKRPKPRLKRRLMNNDEIRY